MTLIDMFPNIGLVAEEIQMKINHKDDRDAMEGAYEAGRAPQPPHVALKQLDEKYGVTKLVIQATPHLVQILWSDLPSTFHKWATNMDTLTTGKPSDPQWRPEVGSEFVLDEVGVLFTYRGEDKVEVKLTAWRYAEELKKHAATIARKPRLTRHGDGR